MKGKDVYWEIHPLFLMSRFLAVAPLDETFVMQKAHLGWTLFILTLAICLGTYLGLFMNQSKRMINMSAFSLILERAQLFIVILTVVVSSLKSIANVKTLYRVMKHLAHLDKKLYDIGVLVPYTRIYGFVLTSVRLVLIMSLCIEDLIVFKNFWAFDSILVQYNLIMLLVGNIVQVQFMVLLEIVQRRIRIITEKLKDISQGDNFGKTNHLHTLVSVHSSLVSICETVNNLYSPQILIILSSIFIVITANLYLVIEKLIVYITLKKGNDLNFFGMTSYKIFVRSLEVWMMVTTCVNTQDLAKEFNINLYQVMIDNKANEISANKKLRLHVSMKRDLVFTACGFFTLDYTLVHSMIAAATTYLVILIQFGNPNEASDDATNQISSNASMS